MDFLRQLMRGIAEAWRRLSLSARVNLALAGVATTAIILLVVYFGSTSNYVILSSDLNAEQASSAATVLAGRDIPYKQQDGYRTLLVPSEFLSDAQLLLAENNVPVGRSMLPGFELFEQTEFMTNQALQDIKYARALQGELQRQLNLFDFVDYSYVLIRDAKEELFTSDQQPSEAAVTLAINRPLEPREIKGIVNIVSAAGGSQLHPRNITVATTDGQVLWSPTESEFAAIAGTKHESIVERERQREQKIERLLQDLGYRAAVSVSANVNFEEKETVARQVTAGTEFSTYTSTTSSSSTEGTPEGTPGALANLPDTRDGGVAPGNTETIDDQSEEIVNFEPSVTTTTTRTQPGDVIKYLVTVIVEGGYGTPDDQGNPTYVGLTDDSRSALVALATSAVGDGTEAPEVSVFDMPFNVAQLPGTVAAMDEAQAAQRGEWMVQWGMPLVYIALIVVALFLLRVFFYRVVERPGEEAEELPLDIPEATREDLRRQEVASEVNRLSVQDPDGVAALLRSWMKEEEET